MPAQLVYCGGAGCCCSGGALGAAALLVALGAAALLVALGSLLPGCAGSRRSRRTRGAAAGRRVVATSSNRLCFLRLEGSIRGYTPLSRGTTDEGQLSGVWDSESESA